MTAPPIEPPRVEPKPVPWRALEGLAIFLIALIITAAVSAAVTFGLALVRNRAPDTDLITVVTILVNEIVLLGTVLAWVRLRYALGPDALGFTGANTRNLLTGVATGIGGLAVSFVVGAVLVIVIQAATGEEVSAPEQIPFKKDPSTAVKVLSGVSVLLFAPLAEETFFRGFVYRGLRRWAAATPAALLSAAVFAVTHVLPLVLLPIFALGVVLARVVERRGSLVPAVVGHMLFNVVGFVFQVVLRG